MKNEADKCLSIKNIVKNVINLYPSFLFPYIRNSNLLYKIIIKAVSEIHGRERLETLPN